MGRFIPQPSNIRSDLKLSSQKSNNNKTVNYKLKNLYGSGVNKKKSLHHNKIKIKNKSQMHTKPRPDMLHGPLGASILHFKNH